MNRLKKLLFLGLGILITLSSLGSSISYAAGESTPAFSFTSVGETRSKVSFDDVKAGDTLTGTLRLSLLADVPTVFTLSFRDTVRRKLEQMEVSLEEIKKLSLAGWLEFPQGEKIVLDGFEVNEFPFIINIPEGVAPGDYSGIFMSAIADYGEKVKDPDYLNALKNDAVGMGTKITIGIGLELLVRVAGELKPDLSFDNLDYFVSDDGRLNVKIKYTNNGNVSVSPQAHLVISDIWGKRYYNNDYRFSIISPGLDAESVIRVNTDDFFLAYGIYNIDVELTYDVYSFSGTDDLLYSSGTGRLRIYSLPWYLFLIIALFVVSILSWFFFRNYRYLKLYKSSMEYLVKDRDTLQSVSNKFKVDPKKIIIVNKIKKPYFLDGGTTILIPNKKNNEKKQ